MTYLSGWQPHIKIFIIVTFSLLNMYIMLTWNSLIFFISLDRPTLYFYSRKIEMRISESANIWGSEYFTHDRDLSEDSGSQT